MASLFRRLPLVCSFPLTAHVRLRILKPSASASAPQRNGNQKIRKSKTKTKTKKNGENHLNPIYLYLKEKNPLSGLPAGITTSPLEITVLRFHSAMASLTRRSLSQLGTILSMKKIPGLDPPFFSAITCS